MSIHQKFWQDVFAAIDSGKRIVIFGARRQGKSYTFKLWREQQKQRAEEIAKQKKNNA